MTDVDAAREARIAALVDAMLPPFEAAVERARTWAQMTSYNRLNGRYVSERAELVNGLLKGAWGFDGLVMSDWFGTNSNEPTASAGLDLEMPGPARHRGEYLAAACRAGAMPAEAVRGGGGEAPAADLPAPAGGRPGLRRLPRRGRPCPLRRGRVRRLPLLRGAARGAAVPLRLRPVLRLVPARRPRALGRRTGARRSAGGERRGRERGRARGLPDGSLPLEHVLGDALLWEADIAWTVRGGADPVPWLDRYRGWVPLVHVKDIAPTGEAADEEGWADVGAGVLPWPDLWRRCREAGAEVKVAEHDRPSDFGRFARRSAAAMRAFAGEGAR